jgi:hypothetical protein
VGFLLCFNNRSKPGASYLQSKIVVLLVGSLYGEAVDAAKSRAVLTISLEEWIWVFGDMISETRF